MTPRRHARLYRRLRSSLEAFVFMYAKPVTPYLNLNLSAPGSINALATTGAPIRIERWVLPPEHFIHPNGFLVDAGLHPLYQRAWPAPVLTLEEL